MSEHLEAAVANNHVLLRELADRVDKLAQYKRTDSGLILPGPGNAAVSRTEYNKLRQEVESLREELALVSDVAMEAVRLLDRMAGMGE